MKYSLPLFFAGAVCLLTSCEKDRETTAMVAPEAVLPSLDSQWNEGDFTPWMSRAELQHFQNTSPSDQYFAHVEGRNRSGRLEYRAVVMPFGGAQYEQWAVFWGIDEEELFKCEMNLLANGFFRQDTQVFADQTGKSVHQIVWLKPKTSVGDQDRIVGEPQQNPDPETIPDPSPPEATPLSSSATAPDIGTAAETAVRDAPVATPVTEGPVKNDAASDIPPAPVSAPAVSRNSVHIVRQGDTLGKIAKSRKVSVAELKAINHLKSDVLRIGQRLQLSTTER
ncbi:LysM peptidoglycan-binding domain-containing protein [Luteolibacter yonseiensis]|uniref:LysM peptidoglycan-binding domain-containing protein n=1 Tax=Luteolibacter yonseiensis TaxID=1144680 RepID=A0A934V899_9BACT|nr:LysM peptidoglycan-binding domain-containing protein [Luteolibacter yonseiensis]MBK1817027.1 LysM peptidoglycan-binding domain-containing protein [Luteolibacter yonseiensis]